MDLDCADDQFAVALIERTSSLSAYSRRLTGSAVDGDDLLQDTLLRCWGARASFIQGSSIGAWAKTVMRNAFLSGRRRARFQTDMPDDAVHRLLSVGENQTAAVDLRDVDWAMTELSNEQRDAVVMASQGATVDEGAARLSITPGTYKSRLSRGRERLRQLIEDRTTPLLINQQISQPKRRKLPGNHERRDWAGVMIG